MSRKCSIINIIILFGMIFILGCWADYRFFEYCVFNKIMYQNEAMPEDDASAEEKYLANFPLKTSFVEVNGLAKRICGQREMNGVTKLDNGWLATLNGQIAQQDLDRYADFIKRYSDYCEQHGAKFLYVQPAYTISKYDPELPVGDEDHTNDNIDYLNKALHDRDISVIDLRECMHDDGIDQYGMYYKTDHHWTTEGAFYAYQHIVDWITDATGCQVDKRLTCLDDYNIVKYHRYHLGSYGQRTGRFFAGIDDYDLIYPDFMTAIHNSNDGTSGTFEEEIVKYDTFRNRRAEGRYTYDRALSKNDTNDLAVDDAKSDLSVYMISDSYAEAVSPYMLLTYRRYMVNDICNSESTSESVFEAANPDVVIIMPFEGHLADYVSKVEVR